MIYTITKQFTAEVLRPDHTVTHGAGYMAQPRSFRVGEIIEERPDLSGSHRAFAINQMIYHCSAETFDECTEPTE